MDDERRGRGGDVERFWERYRVREREERGVMKVRSYTCSQACFYATFRCVIACRIVCCSCCRYYTSNCGLWLYLVRCACCGLPMAVHRMLMCCGWSSKVHLRRFLSCWRH